MTTHRESYTKIYGNKANYNIMFNALVLYVSGSTPFDKWIVLSGNGTSYRKCL